MDDLEAMTSEALASVRLAGWLHHGLQPKMVAVRTGFDTVSCRLGVSVAPSDGDGRTRIALTVSSPIVRVISRMPRVQVQVWAEIAASRLNVGPRCTESPEDIRHLVCDAARDMLAFFLLHELGEHLYVGDRRPWYPAADHGKDAPVPENAGWGPS